MKTIALCAQKGGVGKTTLAFHLAVSAESAGYKTALLDLDPQQSAVSIGERRDSETPAIAPAFERGLVKTLKNLEAAGFDFVVIDTPPAASAEAVSAAELSDLVLIPCRPNALDLMAIQRTAKMLKSVGTPALIVLNLAQPTSRTVLDEARTIATSYGLEACPVALRQRLAFSAGIIDGKTATEIEPQGKAAEEMAALWQWASATLQLGKAARLQHKKKAG